MANTRRSAVGGVFDDRPGAARRPAGRPGASFGDDQTGLAHQPSGRRGTSPGRKAGQESEAGVFAAVAEFFRGLFGSDEEAGRYRDDYPAGRTVVRVRAE